MCSCSIPTRSVSANKARQWKLKIEETHKGHASHLFHEPPEAGQMKGPLETGFSFSYCVTIGSTRCRRSNWCSDNP